MSYISYTQGYLTALKSAFLLMNCDGGCLKSSEQSAETSLTDRSNSFILVQEYCRLSKVFDPSDEQIERLSEIIQMGESNKFLESLLVEADLLMDYELTSAEPMRRPQESWKAFDLNKQEF